MNTLESSEAQIHALRDFFDELGLHHDRLPNAMSDAVDEDDAGSASSTLCMAN
jgi:hypothetical protein